MANTEIRKSRRFRTRLGPAQEPGRRKPGCCFSWLLVGVTGGVRRTPELLPWLSFRVPILFPVLHSNLGQSCPPRWHSQVFGRANATPGTWQSSGNWNTGRASAVHDNVGTTSPSRLNREIPLGSRRRRLFPGDHSASTSSSAGEPSVIAGCDGMR